MSWLDELVQKYRSRSDTVDLCGIVLYTDAHPNIKKVLKDDDYWCALDEISGKRLAIFSVRAAQGKSEFPRPPRGSIGMMVPVWREPRENRALLSDLQLSSTQELPLLVLFTRFEGDLLRVLLPLTDDSLDEAYRSLRSALTLAADAMANISPENLKNPIGVFAAADFAIASRESIQRLSKVANVYQWVRSFMG